MKQWHKIKSARKRISLFCKWRLYCTNITSTVMLMVVDKFRHGRISVSVWYIKLSIVFLNVIMTNMITMSSKNNKKKLKSFKPQLSLKTKQHLLQQRISITLTKQTMCTFPLYLNFEPQNNLLFPVKQNIKIIWNFNINNINLYLGKFT